MPSSGDVFMVTALKLLVNLEHLSIKIQLRNDDIYHAFLQLSFPRLATCHLDLTVPTDLRGALSSFLIRHPTLESFSTPVSSTLEPAARQKPPYRIFGVFGDQSGSFLS